MDILFVSMYLSILSQVILWIGLGIASILFFLRKSFFTALVFGFAIGQGIYFRYFPLPPISLINFFACVGGCFIISYITVFLWLRRHPRLLIPLNKTPRQHVVDLMRDRNK